MSVNKKQCTSIWAGEGWRSEREETLRVAHTTIKLLYLSFPAADSTYLSLAVFQLEVAFHEQVSARGHGTTLYGAAQIEHVAVALHHPVQRIVVGVLQWAEA